MSRGMWETSHDQTPKPPWRFTARTRSDENEWLVRRDVA
jgi:hypothetical protein